MVSTMEVQRETLSIAVGTSSHMGSVSEEEEDSPSSPGSPQYDHAGMMAAAMGDEVTAQLAAAGPVGMAAAAAIVSSKKKKRPHSFETNPSIRKRQQNRLLRKLRQTIEEFATRVGQQAVVVVATPGKPNASFKCFGAKPLEDVVRSLRTTILEDLEHALQQQAPPPVQDDPSLYELPPLIIDGIPTPVEKMTQAQLRAFIPLMLKYSTGRGKPGWGRESTRPMWWPKEIPWANVRMDARSDEEKQKVSWTHALRQIVINCYKYHGREDLLPAFTEDDDRASILANGIEDHEDVSSPTQHSAPNPVASVGVLKYHQAGKGVSALSPTGVSTSLANLASAASSAAVSSVSVAPDSTNTNTSTSSVSVSTETLSEAQVQEVHTQVHTQVHTEVHAQYAQATVLQTISNPDGSVSLIQVDPSNPIITLPDGTTAQVQGVATSDGNMQTFQALSEVGGEGVSVDLNSVTEATLINHDGQLILTGEDGHEYAVKLCAVNEKMWQQGSSLEKSLRTASTQRTQASMQVQSRNQSQNAGSSQSAYPVAGMITVPVSASMYQTMVHDGMQVVQMPKQEPNGGSDVETMTIPAGMVGTPIMTMNGNEPQVLQVFSLKEGTVLTKATITSVGDIKSEEPSEVMSSN